ncbi:MAG: hypothetical protein HYW03_09225 [Deltaproteobacteria bacterium]|nr:hypothetical protein [Deltaproteobacteria bacterium]
MRFVRLLVFLGISLTASNLHSQEQPQDKGKFEIDLSELQKEVDKVASKPYSLGGFAEFQPTLLGIDRGSAFSRLKFFKNKQGSTFDQYNFRLRLEGYYKKNIFSAFFKTDTFVRNDFDGWDEDTKLFEAYASVKPSPGFIVEAGKKVMKWGKGYAWNPASFIDRPKNPEDPEEALEGSTVATADYIRSFDGPLKTVTLTTAVIPVYRHVNAKFGELFHTNFASKLYLLAYDTDLDFMVFTGESRTTRYGFDFSKNLATNVEVHGEFAVINNVKSKFIDASGRGLSKEAEAVSYLLGLRYLTEKETTYILEYYRDGTGLSRERMRDFFSFVDRSYRNFLTTGNAGGLVRGAQLAKGAYGKPNPMRDYLYFRVSQKEPFDILYLTPALTSIINPVDGSLNVIPEVAYSPMTNLELRLRGVILVGRNRTDFGEKQNDYRLELRLRYHFAL